MTHYLYEGKNLSTVTQPSIMEGLIGKSMMYAMKNSNKFEIVFQRTKEKIL